MNRAELIRRLKEAAYLEGEFTLRSGRKSRYYFDKYRFETEPALLRAVAEQLSLMLPADTDRLAGAELGGVPLAAAVALETGLPYVIVRKESKGYGTANRIEGILPTGEDVVLLEDVVTTGGAALKAAQALQEAGAGQVETLVVLDRQEGAAEAFEEAEVPYRALFTASEMGFAGA
ncbi:MAG: orotate phosphoribosyltransferase [Candidatus Brocadiia bacterium]